jgi:hypothetical protein
MPSSNRPIPRGRPSNNRNQRSSSSSSSEDNQDLDDGNYYLDDENIDYDTQEDIRTRQVGSYTYFYHVLGQVRDHLTNNERTEFPQGKELRHRFANYLNRQIGRAPIYQLTIINNMPSLYLLDLIYWLACNYTAHNETVLLFNFFLNNHLPYFLVYQNGDIFIGDRFIGVRPVYYYQLFQFINNFFSSPRRSLRHPFPYQEDNIIAVDLEGLVHYSSHVSPIGRSRIEENIRRGAN